MYANLFVFRSEPMQSMPKSYDRYRAAAGSDLLVTSE